MVADGRAWTAAALAALVAAGPAPAAAAPLDTTLTSRASGSAGAKAGGRSWGPAIAADGRFVAFTSTATNLSVDDRDSHPDVYMRDRRIGVTVLVSRASGAVGAKGDRASNQPAISADGRFVAFASAASNLSPDDHDSDWDVYVRDLRADKTMLVSRASGANGADANASAQSPSISGDGRRIAFASSATNLATGTKAQRPRVYVRDLSHRDTELVSRASGPSGADANGASGDPAISSDGYVVAFATPATNLNAADRDGDVWDVYARDLDTGVTTLVSRASGAKGDGSSQRPRPSADGNVVVFDSQAANLDPDDGDHHNDVFVRELRTGATALVSRATGTAGAKGDAFSANAAISADGHRIAFCSDATNLTSDGGPRATDVFVRDLAAATTTLASRASGAAGPPGNGPSLEPALSADGLAVALTSAATNLSAADPDGHYDVYVRELAADDLPRLRAR